MTQATNTTPWFFTQHVSPLPFSSSYCGLKPSEQRKKSTHTCLNSFFDFCTIWLELHVTIILCSNCNIMIHNTLTHILSLSLSLSCPINHGHIGPTFWTNQPLSPRVRGVCEPFHVATREPQTMLSPQSTIIKCTPESLYSQTFSLLKLRWFICFWTLTFWLYTRDRLRQTWIHAHCLQFFFTSLLSSIKPPLLHIFYRATPICLQWSITTLANWMAIAKR